MGHLHLGTFGIILKVVLELFTLYLLVNGERFQDSVDNDITAVDGDKAELPCNLAIPKERSKVTIVLWYKFGKSHPIYSLDLRGKFSMNESHIVHDESYKNRLTFFYDKNPGILLINPVTTEDAGLFRCRVDFHQAPTRNERINLGVIEPTKTVSIKDEIGNDLKDRVTFQEGDTAILVCQTNSGNPLPRITWWRESALLASATYDVTKEGYLRNILRIPQLSRQDLGAVLTCQASNNNISLPATQSITLNLDLRPLTVDIIRPDKPLSANRQHELRCQTTGSRPQPRLSWFKGSSRLPNHEEFISDDRNVTTSILKMTPHENDNGMYLVCRADNAAVRGTGSSLESSWMMDIHYPPTASLKLGTSLKQENLKEGDDVYFDCSIRANPRIYKVEWKFRGHVLIHNVAIGVIISNQTLVLQRIKRSYMGPYTCVAYNEEGVGESNVLFLKIKYAPYCKKGQKTLYGIAKQESLPITCEVVASPASVHFKWAFNGSFELDSTGKFINSGLKSTLYYTPKSEKDYGFLYCWGKNEVREQQEPCVFRVIPAGPPEPVKNCTIQNETENAVHIECIEGFDGGLDQRFGIEVFEAISNVMIYNVTNATPEFTVHDLDAGKGFLVHVFAFNSRGRSGAMTLVANTLRVAERRTGAPTLLTITPVLGVLIGIVAALVLVAIVIVIIMRLRHSDEEKKKKNRETDAPDRVTTPLKKEIDEMENVEEKNPDIVPTEDDHLYDDVHEKAVLKLNNTNERIYENVPTFNAAHREYENLNNVRNQANRIRQNEDVMYAELQLPNNQRQVPVTSRRMTEPTVYAQIDHTRKAPPITMDYDEDYPHNAETPLMTNHRESTV